MHMLYYALDNSGNKSLKGVFSLSTEAKKVLYTLKGSEKPVKHSVFIAMFGRNYTIPKRGVLVRISLTKPKEYLENLLFRFFGRSWVEKQETF